MTKKQAILFRDRLNKGEFPTLPAQFKDVICTPADELVREIHLAYIFDYGNTLFILARRLFQMGLFDEKYNLTNYGYHYLCQYEDQMKLGTL